MSDTFRCAMCGGVFDKGRSDEEALAETRQHFGELQPDELAVVCDDCFNKMHPDQHPHEVEQAVADQVRARDAKPPG